MPENFVAPSDVSLGLGALSRFDLIFDVGGKRMWIRPNASYGRPFPHPVIGVGFALASRDGMMEVASIAPASPAEKAGLRKGDVIVKLDGEEATLTGFSRLKEGAVAELELKDGSKLQLTPARYF
jgi:S1-C subfamily serine protease